MEDGAAETSRMIDFTQNFYRQNSPGLDKVPVLLVSFCVVDMIIVCSVVL